MKRIILSLMIAFTLVGVGSCMYTPKVPKFTERLEIVNEMQPIEVKKEVETLTTISVYQGIEVRVNPTGEKKITITSNLKDPTLLEIKLENNSLYAGYKYAGKRVDGVKTIIEVSGYAVQGYYASSAAKIVVTSPLKLNEEMKVNVSSAAKVQIETCEAPSLTIEASSASEVSIAAAKATELDIEASAASDVEVNGVVAEKVNTDASSASTVKLSGKSTKGEFDASSGASIHAKKLLLKNAEADVSSAGSIECNAEHLKTDSSLSGNVKNVAE